MADPPAYKRVGERKRQDRLDLIDQQVQEGSLVIRKMTPAELKKWGPVKDPAAAAKRARKKAIRGGP